MAKILIIEDDSVFAAVLEDRLHVAGNAAESTADVERAKTLAMGGGFHLVILKMDMPQQPGLQVLLDLRSRPETATLPVVALSASTQSSDRVAALKAGADEFLSRPVDLEELLIRVGRLLGSRQATPSVMQGDLANHPVWELLQFVQHAGKASTLAIRGVRGSGQMSISGSVVTMASYQRLEGRDAILAVLDLKDGQFRLATEEVTLAGVAEPGIPIPEVLMASAWIEDELKKRQEHLPATGVPLEVIVQKLPVLEDELGEMPIEQVFARLVKSSARLFDLIEEIDSAPPKIRLATAWLIEQGAVAPGKQAQPDQVMTTTEISSTMVLDIALHNLLLSAQEAGFDPNKLPFLLIVEPQAWPRLQQLLERVPGFGRLEALPKLIEGVKLRGGGSASFLVEVGSLSLHVQVLSAESRAQVEAVLSVCAGVLLWLDDAADRSLIEGVIQRLENSKSATSGVLVAHRPEQQALIVDLVDGHERWRSSGHAPQSLIGVLKLLHPRA